MAKLIPTLNSSLSSMTGGEKRVAQSLEDNLDDDYTIWYDVTIGKKQLRPDFTIFHPQRGLLVLEVKDWKLNTIQSADRQSFELLTEGRIKKTKNPLEQARRYALAINNLLCQDKDLVQTGKYHGQLTCPYSYGVVLANITRKSFQRSDLNTILDEHLVICQDEIKPAEAVELQQRLWDMCPYSFGRSVTPHQVDRIRWLMFPTCRLPSEQLSLFLTEHPLSDADPDADLNVPVPTQVIPADLIQIFDLQQETLARSLGDGHRVIHGVAGSGKTMILMYRCSYLAALNPQQPILVLCFNVALASRLRQAIASSNLDRIVHVRHFHHWCGDQLKRHRLNLLRHSDNYIQDLERAVRDAIDKGLIPAAQYSSILIDEGHDFEPEWFRMLTHTLDERKSLLLLYDDAQNLYGRQQNRKKFSFKSVGIEAQGRTSILKTNYRNTIEVLDLAYEFAKDVMQPSESADDDAPVLIKPLSAGRHGHPPKIIKCHSFQDEVKQAIARVKQIHAEGLPWNEIGIFHGLRFIGEEIYTQFQIANIPIEWLNKDAASRAYQPKLDSVKVMTMHSCKGLEFSTVIIPGVGYLPSKHGTPEDDARLLYVAMTRSTDRLVMSYHQESDFVRRLRLSIEHSKPIY
jgi:UvrD-like helicase C-terminal domain/Nuclease-related domain/AAA domain